MIGKNRIPSVLIKQLNAIRKPKNSENNTLSSLFLYNIVRYKIMEEKNKNGISVVITLV
ncbi:hypothetical protein SMI01S_16310 [Sphingobacterium mizutaii NBRC 14946 = DSM 11724]|uniref:Uncharacterized protein n=1 Tax=Sphingobacterium mizutaii NBRC 14946 = DSM 11724 TaxID=1220576 RepID=A0ABQ0W280_9SPHI|nr:hypothetical protein SMI01S_16310 [Sphingobacterium mizutaii NBRC 14946 = DSM 11724]